MADPIGLGVDWTLVNEAVTKWAREYAAEVAAAITKTSHDGLGEQIAAWHESGAPLSDLFRRLEPLYGAKRAEIIGTTEATRAFAKGNEILWEKSEVVEGKRWNTANDELVCPICGPLDGQEVKIGATFKGDIDNPPAHPRCRCWITPVVIGEIKTKAEAEREAEDNAR